jgi:hypothetical protein
MQLTTSTSTSSSDGFFIHSNESIEHGYMLSSRIDKDLMSNNNTVNGNDSSVMGTDIDIDDDPRQTTIDYSSIDNDNSNINNTITSSISSHIDNDNSISIDNDNSISIDGDNSISIDNDDSTNTITSSISAHIDNDNSNINNTITSSILSHIDNDNSISIDNDNSISIDNDDSTNTITSSISAHTNSDNSNSSLLSRADMQSYSSYNETSEIDIETVNSSSFGDDNVDDDRVVLDNSSASFNTSTHEQDSQHSSSSDNLFDSSHKSIRSNTDDSINGGMHFNSSVPSTPIGQLLQRYKGKVVCINSPYFPHCDIYLCGTLHVAHNSISMVQEAIQVISPHYVVLELCESRIDNLEEVDSNANLTISEVLQSTYEQKTLKSLGMGLLAWMQLKAAKMMGSRLGGELTTAAKEAYLVRSTIVLGDRLYAVTIQRIFDKLKLFEKVKIIVLMVWELFSMSLFKLKDYISKTENDTDFVKDEIAR